MMQATVPSQRGPSQIRRLVERFGATTGSTLLVLLTVLLIPLPSYAATPTRSSAPTSSQQDQTWKVNLKDADIRAFITQVADITGYSFVVDPRVKGKVTVLSSAPMNKSEIYDLFLSVLQVHGFAAIPGEEAIKIVPEIDAKQSAENLKRFKRVPGEQLITKVIQVNNANALELVPILRPMVAKYGHLAGVAAANALIISDHASNIARIERIVRELDSPSKYDVDVIQLKQAWVDDMVKLLKELAPEELGPSKNNSAAGKYSVVADERSNRLIIRGDENFREKMRQLVEKLDQPAVGGGTTKVYRLQHADAKDMAKILKGVMGEVAKEMKGGSNQSSGSSAAQGFAILPDEGLNALVVRADPSIMREVDKVVDQLDVRRAQVLIEAAIVEISDDTNRDLGVQFGIGDQSGGTVPVMGTNFSNVGNSLSDIISAIASSQVIGPAAGGLTLGAGQRNRSGVTWGALIQALQTSNEANLLSTPSIITLDNQESEIQVGQNVPFKTGETTTTSGGTTNPFTTIERKDIGLTLKVTPSISSGNLVRLKVEQTTEDVTNSVQNASDIVTNKRSIKTTVLADNGQTIVLGGLIQENYKTVESKVPLLGDIPYLGRLFSSQSREKVKENLLVFLRPTIIRNKDQGIAATQRKFDTLWKVNLGLHRKHGEKVKNLEKPDVDSVFQENEFVKPGK